MAVRARFSGDNSIFKKLNKLKMSEIYNTYPQTFTVPNGAVKFKVVVHDKILSDLANIDIQFNSGDNIAPELTGQIAITSDWGDTLAYCQDEIKQANNQLAIPLYEPIWIQPAETGTATGGQGFRIDGFNLFKDFGIIISEVNDYKNIPKRIDVGTTDYYKNTGYRENGIMNIIGAFNGDLVENTSKFYALMSSPCIKTFTFPDNTSYQVYASLGCQVKEIFQDMATFQMTLNRIV